MTLIISSVKQEGGKWVADARLGGADAAKTRPVNIDIDASGSKPSLRFKGAAGTEYSLNLFSDKELVGTATLTTSQAGRGARDRSVKLDKKEQRRRPRFPHPALSPEGRGFSRTLAPEGAEGRVRGKS